MLFYIQPSPKQGTTLDLIIHERERQRQKQNKRETETETETQRQRETDTQRDTHISWNQMT